MILSSAPARSSGLLQESASSRSPLLNVGPVEGRGHAKNMARALISVARSSPLVRRVRMSFVGEDRGPVDVPVWRWQLESGDYCNRLRVRPIMPLRLCRIRCAGDETARILACNVLHTVSEAKRSNEKGASSIRLAKRQQTHHEILWAGTNR